MYDQSGWRVGLLQCLYSLKGAQQVRGQCRNGGGLVGVLQCRRGGSTNREERDADAEQQVVVSWAWQRHGTAAIELLAFRKFDGSEKVNHSSYLNERSANISNALEM
ncbi:hypothetical protein GW17_00033345 [Ensete ventricosum]|nr:hypothetical protein GW17_00033345 [Ensete ventricosum]